MVTDPITTILAIWGACLGTVGTAISVALAVREFRKDRHQIKIHTSISNEDLFWVMSGGKSQPYLVINVLNTGFRPIQVVSVALILSNGKTVNSGKLDNEKLPKILEESASVNVYFAISEIVVATGDKKTWPKAALVTDAKGTMWKIRIPMTIIKSLKSDANSLP